ncbi:MAG TPA: VCBS repeat-containing protein [Bryobacteraceae bacterium]
MAIRTHKGVGRAVRSHLPQAAWLLPIALLLSFSAQQVQAQAPWGATGDIRINADFDGDGNLDYVMWRPVNGSWYVYYSSDPGTLHTKQWGLPGDIPVPGDYDGDHKTDYAVWRPDTGTWYIELSDGTQITQQWGLIGDIPIPADYDGDGKTDLAVYRPSDGSFYVKLSGGGELIRQLGQMYDSPFTGDFNGDGKADMAVFRPSTDTFYELSSSSDWNTQSQVGFGNSTSDIPFVGDFDADGKTDFAVWRPYDPSITGWSGYHPGAELHIEFSKGGSTYYQSVQPSDLFATNFKVPGFDNTVTRVYDRVEGDFDGDHVPDYALFDSQTDRWFIVPSTDPSHPIQQTWGVSAGDIPVPADYFGYGHTDLAVWSPSNGRWYITSNIHDVTDSASWLPPNGNVQFGGPGVDIPVPGDYDGDGRADLAVWRPQLAVWYVETTSDFVQQPLKQWGLPGDIPVPGDYDGDGKTDFAVFRPGLATWYVVPSGSPSTPTVGLQWGLPIGDQPVVGDFNADGMSDFIIWRPATGMYFALSPSGSSSTMAIGVAGSAVLLNNPPLTPSLQGLNFGFMF